MQKPEETMLRELFQQLKQDDERRAPLFAANWAAARARLEKRGRAVPVQWWSQSRWRWLTAALLIVGGLIAYRTMPNDALPDKQGLTAKPSSSPPFVKREEQVAQVSVTSAPRRGLRVPQPQRRNRPRPHAPIVPEIVVTAAQDGEDKTDFIPLRYGADHPPMESGEVIRVQMPRSALVAFGLPVTVERADEPVKADLLIGENGQARAIRFVRQLSGLIINQKERRQ